MPTKKQRKRRLKERRHDYEFVYVDEAGQEVEVSEPEAPKENGKAPQPLVGRGGRTIEPPSWRRAGKRALWVGPLMFLTLTLIASDLSLFGRVYQTFVMLALFLPMSYLMDRAVYRASVRRKSPPR